MRKGDQLSRRSFLKTTGAMAAGMSMLSAKSFGRVLGANDRINTAILGCGHIAEACHVTDLLPLVKDNKVGILTVCDVYATRARAFQDRIQAEGGTKPTMSKDYRDILKNKDVDYVTVTSPEHWHHRMVIDALDAGKHVYVEKPVTHTIEEANEVVDKAKQTGLKVQVGVQGMSDDTYATAYEAICEGKIGQVIHAQTEYCRDYDLASGPWRKQDVDPDMPKPADLDWESWLGPAPQRPWEPRRYFEWRNYKDYSGGIATDLFIHRLTRLIRACGLEVPVRVAGLGGIYVWPDGRELPDNMEMLAEYGPVKHVGKGMTVHVLGTMANRHTIEHLVRGTTGTLVLIPNVGWKVLEPRTNKVLAEHARNGEEKIGLHHQNLHDAIRGKAALNCPPELGRYGLVAVAMANLSWFNKKMMTWDEQSRKAV